LSTEHKVEHHLQHPIKLVMHPLVIFLNDTGLSFEKKNILY